VASPDGTQLLLAYAPPGSGAAALNYNTDLYLVPMDGSSPPRPLVSRQDPGTQSYFNPQWAPDGRSIYATFLYQITPTAADPSPYQNDIVQISLQGAQKVLIHQHALWPRLSPDGARMAYLYVDPQSLSNDLYLARADGTQPAPLLQPGSATPIDDHLFTPDGSQVIFSMVNGSGPSKGSWFERWLGVTVASAHNVPSDWYRMPAAGGEPQRITRLNDTGMYAALAPDGKHMAFISSAGLYLMNLDGSDLYQVTRQTFIGTIDWIK
jgi:Tol biopolymer transport system component